MSVQSGRRTRKTRTRLAPEERREQILEAATRAFVRGGYHGTHVDDVIREAGIARGTFYLYFDSKHAVFAALLDRVMLAAFEVRSPIGEQEMTDGAAVEEVLREHYRAFLAHVRRSRDLWLLLLDEAAGADKGFTEQLAAHRTAWQRRIRDFVRTLSARGIAGADVDAEAVGWMVVGMVEMTVRRYALGESAPNVGRLARALAAFEVSGVLATPRP